MTANTLSSTCFDKIFKDLDQKKIWTSDLLFNLNDKLETDPEFVNLSEILKSRNNFAFPSHFNGVENKSKLIIALRLSAMKCGFCLVLRVSFSVYHFQPVNTSESLPMKDLSSSLRPCLSLCHR